MHDGCSGAFSTGKETVDKVRQMGFAEQYLPLPIDFNCKGCGKEIEMVTFETKCPHCNMVHGVVPCHAFDNENITGAGIDY